MPRLVYSRETMRLLYKRFLRTACAIGTLEERPWVHFPRGVLGRRVAGAGAGASAADTTCAGGPASNASANISAAHRTASRAAAAGMSADSEPRPANVTKACGLPFCFVTPYPFVMRRALEAAIVARCRHDFRARRSLFPPDATQEELDDVALRCARTLAWLQRAFLPLPLPGSADLFAQDVTSSASPGSCAPTPAKNDLRWQDLIAFIDPGASPSLSQFVTTPSLENAQQQQQLQRQQQKQQERPVVANQLSTPGAAVPATETATAASETSAVANQLRRQQRRREEQAQRRAARIQATAEYFAMHLSLLRRAGLPLLPAEDATQSAASAATAHTAGTAVAVGPAAGGTGDAASADAGARAGADAAVAGASANVAAAAAAAAAAVRWGAAAPPLPRNVSLSDLMLVRRAVSNVVRMGAASTTEYETEN